MQDIRIKLPKLHAGQLRATSEAKRFNALECGRRFGKTKLGIVLAARAAIDMQAPCGWFAPAYKYVTEAWREICGILKPAIQHISQQEKRIEIIGGGVIECWSLEDPDAGRSRKYKRVIVDEAGIVRDLQTVWQQAIRPTLTDLKGDAWFLGTPKGRNFFHQIFARGESGDSDWKSWRMPTVANPFIEASEVEAARRDMPESAFNQEYLGIPADDGGNPFGLTAIASCLCDLSDQPPAFFGIDLAKSYDWTVVVGLDEQGKCSVLERWQSDWAQTKRRILDIIEDKPALVDSTGVGDPIVEDLQREANVTGFNFSLKSKQRIMEGLAAAVQRKEIGFPDGWLRHEMDSFEYEYVPSGVRYSAPSGLHDDGVCGLALAVECSRTVARVFPTESAYFGAAGQDANPLEIYGEEFQY